ncbi:hypothetical protein ACIP93_31290 [Streptomyces sp. NPDC088745]|uniref:hypothetical protein n=1 Tax=Streptomyces sp. NPDC088745 TaxID=3365884 RepID=UPI0037FA28F8
MSVALTARLIPPKPRRGSARAGKTPLAVPAGSLPAPRRRGLLARGVRRTGAAARAGVFTVLTVLAVVLGTPMSTAQAAPFGLDCIGVPGKGNWGPEFYASASTVLLPSAQPEYGPEPTADMSKKTVARNYTLYELTNGRGLLWSTYKKNVDGDDSCSIMDVAGNWMAQTVFEFSKSLGSFSLAIQDLAMNTAPFQDLYQGKDGTANSLVAKLYATVWAPLGTVMIILCGAWVVVHSRTKSRSKVWQGLGGMVASLFISALLLQGSWYTTVTSEADKAINGFSSAMTEVMLPENAGTKTADPCWLAEGVPNRAKRISSCTMYKAMMFTPWAAGQFGQNANTVIDSGWKGDASGGWDTDDCSLGYRCTDIRTAQVMAQTYTRADNLDSLGKKSDYFEKVADQMAKDDRKSRFNDWRGANPSSRMQVALASGVSNVILAPSIDIVALFKLFWEGFILILIIVLPIVGAVAAFPPATFAAREWANAFTISFVLKAIAWVALTLLMAIYTLILGSNASLGVQVLMIILTAAGLWHFAIKMGKGAKRSADQAFEAKAAYDDVTSRAGSFAKTRARSAARRVIGDRRPSPRGTRRPQGPKGPSESTSGRGGSGPSRPGTSGGRRPSPSTTDSPTDTRRPEPVSGRRPDTASGGRSRADTRGADPDATAKTSKRADGSDSRAGVGDDVSRPAGGRGRTPAPTSRPDGSGGSGGEAATTAPPTRAPSPRAGASRPGPEPVSISGPDRSDPVPRRRSPRPAPAPATESGELPRRPTSPRPPVDETPPRPPAPRED